VAVIAERGPIKFTRAPVTIEAEDGDNKKKGKAGVNEPEKSFGKKYVNLKLINFGARSLSTIGGASVIRGDAFLTLLLFKSDGFDLIPREDGMKPEKIYKGGSRGAFEHLTNVKEGDVIALLNPKILKPFQVDTSRILNQVIIASIHQPRFVSISLGDKLLLIVLRTVRNYIRSLTWSFFSHMRSLLSPTYSAWSPRTVRAVRGQS